MYDIAEIVLIPMKVVKREFDDRGNIKYKLKDQKSGKILDWAYSIKDMLPCEQPKPKVVKDKK